MAEPSPTSVRASVRISFDSLSIPLLRTYLLFLRRGIVLHGQLDLRNGNSMPPFLRNMETV